MGFDAGNVRRDHDDQRLLRDSPFFSSMKYEVRRNQKMLRSFSGVDGVLRSFGGMDQVVPDASNIRSNALRLARAAGGANFVGANTASLYADLANRVVPESMRRGLPALSRNLASMGYYPHHPRSSVVMLRKMLGPILPSRHVAQAFAAHGIDSSYSADWRLRIVHSFRTPALQSILKASTTFGPIVVSPDDEPAYFDYHPDLKGWLIPETATDSGDAMDVERLLAEVIAFAVDVAQQYDSKALINVVGKHGGTFLIGVSETVVGGLILFWLLHR